MFLIYLASFIISALAILLGSHYLLYLSVLYFFSVVDPVVKTTLFSALAFWAVSFILATLLMMLKENFVTRSFYFISGFWEGLFMNLMMATISIWIIFDISQLIKSDINVAALATFFFSLALLYSLYGVWNARSPRIKNISVFIPNLPNCWKNKRIVQLSDIHIGHVNRKKFVKDVTKKVNSIEPEMVVITGDLFDGMDGDLESPVKLINGIKSKRDVFFITGNHETYLGLNQVKNDLAKTNAVMLNDEVRDIDGLKLIGINYPDRTEKKNMLAILKSLQHNFIGQPNILLYHSPVRINEIKDMGVNLELCGHTHRGQLFPLNYISRLIYKKYHYGLHTIGTYTLYTTSGTGSWGPPMRTGNAPEIVAITLRG